MLKTHLSNIGLKDFDDREKLFEWGYSLLKNYKIPSNVIVTFFKYLKKVENNNSYFYKKKLYKIAACNKVLLNFFHSIEFSRIYKSGSHIAKNIKNNKQILDLGCNSGYLTSYYAKKFSLISAKRFSILGFLPAPLIPDFESIITSFIPNFFSFINGISGIKIEVG